MKNLAKAVIAVMKEVKGIEKSMNVGTGTNSYKGVPDQEVKKKIGEAMATHGLCLLPIGVESKTQVDRWEETTQYGTKMKQSVFTESHCKYLLLHESGESQEIMGYGQGTDSQDKSAGKSTTYALKYAMLYTFLVPTGKIDDADETHSDEIPVPEKKPVQVKEPTTEQKAAMMQKKPALLKDIAAYQKDIDAIKSDTELVKYWNESLLPVEQSNPDIIALFKKKRESLKLVAA